MHDGRVWSEQEDVIKAFGLKEFQKGLAYYSDGSVLMAVEENGIIRGQGASMDPS